MTATAPGEHKTSYIFFMYRVMKITITQPMNAGYPASVMSTFSYPWDLIGGQGNG